MWDVGFGMWGVGFVKPRPVVVPGGVELSRPVPRAMYVALAQVRQLRREADFLKIFWTEIGFLDVCSLPGFLWSGRMAER